jgi:peroxiredoxin Q/BCP
MTRTLAPIAFCGLALFATACQKDAPAKSDAPAATTAAKASATPSASAATAAEPTPLKEGDAAPDVDLVLQNGKTVKLSSYRGKYVAIYFYPKDQTPGCTVEAEGIRDTWTDLSSAGVAVIGVSAQDADSHKAFIDKEKLPYDLAVDTDGKIADAFHVPSRGGYHARQTFLVGKDGKLAKVWLNVKPDGHAKDILAAAKS